MSIKLYHHPFSRAANVVVMLEELGEPYALEHVNLMGGAHKTPEFLALNPMGKLPTIVIDDEVVMTEQAAIGMYLADRYALGRLAPTLDDPRRATYLRWFFYAPSVIEPGCAAHSSKYEYRASAVGWGTYDEMLNTIEAAIGDGPWLLGDMFTMCDVMFAGTLNYMLQFKMLDARPAYLAYVDRFNARPAVQKAAAINGQAIKDHGLDKK